MILDTWFFSVRSIFKLSRVGFLQQGMKIHTFQQFKCGHKIMCSFSTQRVILQKYTFLGPYFNTHNSGTTTLNLFFPTRKIFLLNFHKKSKNSTIEALWGTVISPLPKKGTVQYSAKNSTTWHPVLFQLNSSWTRTNNNLGNIQNYITNKKKHNRYLCYLCEERTYV